MRPLLDPVIRSKRLVLRRARRRGGGDRSPPEENREHLEPWEPARTPSSSPRRLVRQLEAEPERVNLRLFRVLAI